MWKIRPLSLPVLSFKIISFAHLYSTVSVILMNFINVSDAYMLLNSTANAIQQHQWGYYNKISHCFEML